LLYIFNFIYDTREVPKSFGKAIVFPLFKKGNINQVKNYRGISFLDADSKLFTGILLRSLVVWLENKGISNEFQAGFRKKYSTIDNISNLVNIVQLKLVKKRTKIDALFVDLKAAFDHVDRQALLYKTYTYGVPSKLINIIQKLYKSTGASVWHREGVSEDFATKVGLKQGCQMSPVFFAIFLNDLHDSFGGGVKIANTKVRILAYGYSVGHHWGTTMYDKQF
jgi:hypothetical protein